MASEAGNGLERSLHAAGNDLEPFHHGSQNDGHSTDDSVEHEPELPVWNDAQDHSPWETAHRADQAHSPEDTGESSHAEGGTANVYDHDLAADHNEVDAQEPVVAEHALEDIEVVVEATVVELVKDLHPDEGVEDDCGELAGAKTGVCVGEVGVEEFVAGEVEHEGYGQLVDCLAEDHFPHCHCEEGGAFGDGLSVEDLFCWGVGCSVGTVLVAISAWRREKDLQC